MFDAQFQPDAQGPDKANDRLRNLLQKWEAVEPAPGFESAVWQKIRAAPAEAPRRIRFELRPAWMNVAAAAAGVLLGVGLAFFTDATPGERHTNEPLLQARTLAGSYLAMATGGAR